MKLPRWPWSVALAGILAGCAATVDDVRGLAGDGGAGSDASDAGDAVVAMDAGAGCAGEIDVAREGEAVAGGYRVAVDFRGAPRWTTLRTEFENVEYQRLLRLLAFTAPDDGVYAFTVASPSNAVLFNRIVRCAPPTASPGVQPRNEPLLDGFGQQYRLRRGEAVLAAVGGGGLHVVSVRRMNDRAAGEACTVNDACPAGLACAGGICDSGGVEGAPCAASDPPCGPGLYCAEEGPVHARCRRRSPTGGTCGNEQRCAEGLACAYPLCVPAGTQGAPCGARAPAGTACAAGFFCTRGEMCARRSARGEACGGALECDDDGVACVRIAEGVRRCAGPGDLGGACRDGATPCAEGLACEEPTRRCVLPLPLGAACLLLDLHACDGGQCEGLRCAPAGARGQKCRALGAPRCDAGLVCDRETCVAPLALGARCDASARVPGCVGGRCLGGFCVAASGRVDEACRSDGPNCDDGARCVEGRCVARGGLGAACEGRQPDECAEGLTCSPTSNGRCVYRNAASRACAPGGACAPGRTCIEGECIAPGVCDRLPSAFGPVRCDVDAYCVERDATLRCVPAGGEGARCRTRGSPCDAGLLCSAWGLCARAVAPVGACGVPWYDPCPEAASCVRDEGGGVRCAAPGTRYGLCRRPLGRADACDAGLVCDVASAVCVPAAGDGPCGTEAGIERACPDGSACVADSPTQSRCVRDGAARGRCRPYAPRCDPGHRCEDNLGWCVREAPDGEPCPTGTDARCATGLACLADINGARRCERARTLGARCGPPGPFDTGCNTGLACFDGRCVVGVPEGGRCDRSDATKQCASGLVCAAEPDGDRCRAAASEGQRCEGLACRPGLACNGGWCVRLVVVGEACAPAASGGPVCASARCAEGRCAQFGSLGGRCGGDSDCGGDLVCRRDTVVDGFADPHCAPRPPGDRPCDGTDAMRCAPTATCVNNRCVPDGSPGGLCRVAATPRCDATARCDPATARCVR